MFSSTREAIRAAVELQERFVEETLEPPALPLTVGIGLDAGEAVAVQGGYRGGALNLAARLCGQARAGEILGIARGHAPRAAVDGVRYEQRGSLSPSRDSPNLSGRPGRAGGPRRRRTTAPLRAASSRRSGRPRGAGPVGRRDRNRPRARRDRDPLAPVRRTAPSTSGRTRSRA